MMSDFINKIKKIKGLNKIEGCSIKQVQEAQTELDMSFPDEFIDYVREFGCIDFGPTEWTTYFEISDFFLKVKCYLPRNFVITVRVIFGW